MFDKLVSVCENLGEPNIDSELENRKDHTWYTGESNPSTSEEEADLR